MNRDHATKFSLNGERIFDLRSCPGARGAQTDAVGKLRLALGVCLSIANNQRRQRLEEVTTQQLIVASVKVTDALATLRDVLSFGEGFVARRIVQTHFDTRRRKRLSQFSRGGIQH